MSTSQALDTVQLPTMYDLPYAKGPKEPGLPDVFHYFQPKLLYETFHPVDHPLEQRFVGVDINLYYNTAHTGWYKRPDWFAVLGVSHLYHGHDLRYSYVTWDEQVNPYVVVELLSDGTEDEDLGQSKTIRTTEQPPSKWTVYEQHLKIPYYIVYGRQNREVYYFQLKAGRYQRLYPDTGYLWLEQAKLGLGLWQGEYEGFATQWLRFCDAQGDFLLTPTEQADQRAQQAQQVAQQEQQRANEAEAELARLRALLKQQNIADNSSNS